MCLCPSKDISVSPVCGNFAQAASHSDVLNGHPDFVTSRTNEKLGSPLVSAIVLQGHNINNHDIVYNRDHDIVYTRDHDIVYIKEHDKIIIIKHTIEFGDMQCIGILWHHPAHIVNPQRTCAVRVTVVGLFVCLSVC